MINMSKLQESFLCPCGSHLPYPACCGLYHSGCRIPSTAEALMRSRYTAYVLKNEDYLLASWHPNTRPTVLDIKKNATNWIGLKIIAVEAGLAEDTEGTVEFFARYKIGGRAEKMREKSHFVRVDDRWFYVDGV
jgi:SEC-C motif-containing protein